MFLRAWGYCVVFIFGVLGMGGSSYAFFCIAGGQSECYGFVNCNIQEADLYVK